VSRKSGVKKISLSNLSSAGSDQSWRQNNQQQPNEWVPATELATGNMHGSSQADWQMDWLFQINPSRLRVDFTHPSKTDGWSQRLEELAAAIWVTRLEHNHVCRDYSGNFYSFLPTAIAILQQQAYDVARGLSWRSIRAGTERKETDWPTDWTALKWYVGRGTHGSLASADRYCNTAGIWFRNCYSLGEKTAMTSHKQTCQWFSIS